MKTLKTSFSQQPILAIASLVFSVYIASLLALAIVVTIAPDSKLGSVLDNLF